MNDDRLRQRGRGATLACVLAAALFLVGCSSKSPRELDTRAVVIGIDSADWKIIEALAKDGGMPNLMRLRERGVWGPIATLDDIPLSPVIWTSIATGKKALKHGVTWFMVDQPDGTRAPVRSYDRKAEALWNIAASNDLASTTVGWWASYPAENVDPGAMVSDALGFHGFGESAHGADNGRKTYPPALFGELAALVPAEQEIPFEFAQRFLHLSAKEYRDEMFDPARSSARDPVNPIHLFQQYAVTAQGYTAISEELLSKRPYDLFMVYFEQVDSLSHLFMKYAPPRLDWVDERGYARYRDVVSEWYRYQDELLGRLLAKIDLEKTAVFVVSDHGFKSGERRVKSEGLVDTKRIHLDHETHGIFLAAGPHVRRGGQVADASVLDITPTLLHYLGLPVAKDMDGKVLEGVFEPEFMQRRPVRAVATYEGARRNESSARVESMDPRAQREAEKQLSHLGYTGDDPDEGSKGAGRASSPEIHNNLGRIHLREGNAAQALVEFGKALAIDPKNADALLLSSVVHHGRGEKELALQFVQRALAADPRSTGALAQLALIRRDEGQLDEALRLFDQALAIDASQASLFMGKGDVLQRARRFEEALAAFTHVLDLEPDSFRARFNLGVTYTNMGRVEEALAMYTKALELAPQDSEAPSAHDNLGLLLLSRGKPEQALVHFETALKAAPKDVVSRFNAALIHLGQGRSAQGIELLEQAVKLQPENEQVNLRLGMAYLAADRGKEAYKPLELVHRLYPNDWGATLGLAALHARDKQPEKARALLDEALKQGGTDARRAAESFPDLRQLLGN